MRRSLVRGLALALLAVITAACGSSSTSTGDDSLSRVKTDGIRVAFYDLKPWSYIDSQSNWTGLDAELVQMCGKQLGITQFSPTVQPFDALIPGLVAHRFDVIASGLYTSKQREAVVAPSQGLYQLGDVALVAKGNPLGIHSWSDLATKHATVGVVPGGVEVQLAQKYGIQTKTYETVESEVADLRIGRIQAIPQDRISLGPYVQANANYVEIATPWDYQGNVSTPAIWFNKADNALRTSLDGCISEMKQNGTYGHLLVKYGLTVSDQWPAGQPGPAA